MTYDCFDRLRFVDDNPAGDLTAANCRATPPVGLAVDRLVLVHAGLLCGVGWRDGDRGGGWGRPDVVGTDIRRGCLADDAAAWVQRDPVPWGDGGPG